MCGIIGTIPALDPELFNRGFHALDHRGPDADGIWKDSNNFIQLGHKRLSIIDTTKAGNQPMHFQNLTIVYNGEVFNYVEIKEELVKEGYFFSSHSDTEVILKAYHAWGKKAFDKFNGMWAIAIYDNNTHELLLCRDRYGIKPLYYYHSEDLFVFASEVQAIHKLLGKDHPLNTEVLKNIAEGGFAWHGSESSYLQGVRVLSGGKILQFSNSKIYEENWYQLTQVDIPKTFPEQAKTLRNLLFDAIKIRLRSDVSVGTCLSGGVDSGTISSFINNMEQDGDQFDHFTHQSFCAAFPDTPINESDKANRLAKQLNLSLDVVDITPPIPDELEKAMLNCDGPMHAMAFFPIWKLYKYIREQGIVVTLDGQGPDEILGGYKPLKYALLGAFEDKNIPYAYDLYKTYMMQGETAQSSSKANAKHITKNVIKNEFKDVIKRISGRGILSDKSQQSGPDFLANIFDRNLHYQFFKAPLPAILQQYDRCSMAHGVECRMPFMDFRIVEFLFSLPSESKVGKGYTKRILREASKGILPNETRLDRTKIGFNAPIVDWFKGELKEWMLEIVNSKAFLESPYFDGKELNTAFKNFLASDNAQWNDAWRFWGPVHITKWIETVDNQ